MTYEFSIGNQFPKFLIRTALYVSEGFWCVRTSQFHRHRHNNDTRAAPKLCFISLQPSLLWAGSDPLEEEARETARTDQSQAMCCLSQDEAGNC